MISASGSSSSSPSIDADLDQADFFGISVKAVGLGVEREPLGGAEFRQKRGEFFVGVNQGNIFNRKGAKAQSFLKFLCVFESWRLNFAP